MQAAHDSATAAKCSLAVEVLRSFGMLRLRVTGSSMFPSIRPGDVLWFRRCGADDAKRGDVVLFARYGRLFAHRVIGRSGACLVTQGDGLAGPDPPLPPEQVVGRACRILRRGRAFRPTAQLALRDRLAAPLARHSSRAGRLVTRIFGLAARAGP